MTTTKKLIIGSPEAMKMEKSLNPPEDCPTKRELLRDYPKEERLDQFFKRYVNIIPDEELDIHPEMEDNPK
jgi:hypothetical protein|tara:strand:- start:916 stop:1128 length:213 start_codon:yes stop_codon:yes gene_type:complete